MNMQSGVLRRFDLNLLLAFDALLEERSVSRAAHRCFLSQPAMSNALNRLRAALDDPVLVRTSGGMAPTPRALALAPEVHAALQQLDRLLRPRTAFDPATTRRRFRIALTDYGENVLLPPLGACFREHAPHAALEAAPLEAELPEAALQRGDIDLAIAVEAYCEVPARLRCRPWIEERMVCLAARDGDPPARLTLAGYLGRRHVYPSPLGVSGNIVDDWLARQGRAREIALTANGYLAAARAAVATGALLSVPRRVARVLVTQLPLAVVTPPRGFPGFRLLLVWHPLHEGDAALGWLVERVLGLDVDAD